MLDIKFKRIGVITTLHQEDYKGKRVYVEIKDKTYSFRIKLDIGIHTMFAIKQKNMEFKILKDGKTITLLVNPIEQLIGEKLYSLAKHGINSTRYKDIFDIYYLINNVDINKRELKQCLNILIEYGKSNVTDLVDMCERIEEVFGNNIWYQRFTTSDYNWIDENDYRKILNTIVRYLNLI